MQFIMKTRHDNYMIDRTSVISIEYDIELSRPIELCTIYDENKIGQWYDRLYTCDLRRIWYLIVKTD